MKTAMKALLLLAGLSAAPGPENPEYGWWASFARGAWVKVRIEGVIEDRVFTLEQTHLLVEVTPDKVVVDRRGTLRIGDAALPGTKERDEVARVDEHALRITAEQEENVVISKVALRSRRIEGTDPRTNSRVKLWIVKEVPGGVVRGEILPEGAPVPTKIEILDWGTR